MWVTQEGQHVGSAGQAFFTQTLDSEDGNIVARDFDGDTINLTASIQFDGRNEVDCVLKTIFEVTAQGVDNSARIDGLGANEHFIVARF